MEIKGNINAGYGNSITGSTKSSIVGGIGNVVVGNNNIIGGGSGNTVNTNSGVVVGGSNNLIPSAGGTNSSIVGGNNNEILNANKSFIGGGDGNELRQNASLTFIGGGYKNSIGITGTSTINGGLSVIVGGGNNYISSGGKGFETTYAFIGGGSNNYIIEGTYSFIGGGGLNRITGNTSTIVGGAGNTINGFRGFIGGGDTNIIESSSDALIGNGQNNYIGAGANNSAIINGSNNYIKPIGSSGPFLQSHNLIGGGKDNRITSYSNVASSRGYNVILGSEKANIYGYSYHTHNTIIGTGWLWSAPISNYSSAIKGSHNSILGGVASYNDRYGNPTTGITHGTIGFSYLSTLVNGYGNLINNGYYTTIVNGYHNYAGPGNNNFIGTGYHNIIKTSRYVTIGNGSDNGIYLSRSSTILGGVLNVISGTSTGYSTQSRNSTILGGRGNLLRSSRSSIIGGYNNTINLNSPYSSILGGQSNTISHSNAHIIGSNITSISANTTHVERLNIGTIGGGTPVGNLGFDSSGNVVTGTTGGGGGESNTASNVGVGQGVFKQKSGVDLQFYSLSGGTNTTLTLNGDTVVVDSSGGSSTTGSYTPNKYINTGGVTVPAIVGNHHIIDNGHPSNPTTYELPDTGTTIGDMIKFTVLDGVCRVKPINSQFLTYGNTATAVGAPVDITTASHFTLFEGESLEVVYVGSKNVGGSQKWIISNFSSFEVNDSVGTSRVGI